MLGFFNYLSRFRLFIRNWTISRWYLDSKVIWFIWSLRLLHRRREFTWFKLLIFEFQHLENVFIAHIPFNLQHCNLGILPQFCANYTSCFFSLLKFGPWFGPMLITPCFATSYPFLALILFCFFCICFHLIFVGFSFMIIIHIHASC